MQDSWLQFFGDIAWPVVALIGLLILGPGGVLQKLIGELAEKLFAITTVVNEFKATASDFEKSRKDLKDSTSWVSQLDDQLNNISSRLESINLATQSLAISEGNRTLLRSVEENNAPTQEPTISSKSSDEMFDDIRTQWDDLIKKLKDRVGDNVFDARSIGQMAWKLVDGRRSYQLTPAEAELLGNLHSQMKRFNRLQSSKDEWLTHDIYAAFIKGVEQADAALG